MVRRCRTIPAESPVRPRPSAPYLILEVLGEAGLRRLRYNFQFAEENSFPEMTVPRPDPPAPLAATLGVAEGSTFPFESFRRPDQSLNPGGPGCERCAQGPVPSASPPRPCPSLPQSPPPSPPQAFIARSAADVGLELHTLHCADFRSGLQAVADRGVRAVFMGTRKTDPDGRVPPHPPPHTPQPNPTRHHSSDRRSPSL